MKEGELLYLRAQYGFDYDRSHYYNVNRFEILTQFFKNKGLKGFINNDLQGTGIEEGSELDITLSKLYNAFDEKNIGEVVKEILLEYEMYEILTHYKDPQSEEGKELKKMLLNESK
jgi:hypothetical protein